MDRRQFIQSSAVAAAALSTAAASGQEAEPKRIRVGLCGCGAWGRLLAEAIAGLPGNLPVDLRAVYDVVRNKQISMQRSFAGRALVGIPETFENLLTNHRLDALIIATPDHCHARQAIAAMEAGLAVYCEVPLAPSLQDARAMLAAQRKTGKLLQAGYQRRSNPRYRQLQADVLARRQLLGRISGAYSQWHRAVKPPLKPKLSPAEQELMRAAGYADVMEFANWRNYRKFSTGLAHSLGANGVHTMNWLLGALPDRVMASGGTDYYDGKDGRPLMEGPDSFSAAFHYRIGGHTVRYNCQVNLATGSGGHYEKVMGTGGWTVISESPEFGNEVFREPEPDREKFESAWREGVLKLLSKSVPLTETSRLAETIDGWSGPSEPPPPFYSFSRQEDKRSEYYHVENFFRVLARGGTQSELACPAEEAWTTLVCMAKLQESMDQRREVEITPADFAV